MHGGWVHGRRVALSMRLFHAHVCACNAAGRTECQCTGAVNQGSPDLLGWSGHPEFLLLGLEYYQQDSVGIPAQPLQVWAGIVHYAQTWDAREVGKFITTIARKVMPCSNRFIAS